jgi:hypothetical protein
MLGWEEYLIHQYRWIAGEWWTSFAVPHSMMYGDCAKDIWWSPAE